MQTFSEIVPRFGTTQKDFFEEIENKLDEADFFAKIDSARMTHDEVFSSLRRIINDK